jgi:hypothetical protein
VSIAQGKCQRLTDAHGYVRIVGDLDPDAGFVVVEHHSGNMSAPCVGGTVQTQIAPINTCTTNLESDDLSYTPFDDVSSQVRPCFATFYHDFLQVNVSVAYVEISNSTSFSITCRAPIISHSSHLTSFIDRDCTKLTGNLIIGSPDHVFEEDLHRAFGMVESIDGNIIIRDSAGLTTLYFLSSLKEVGNVTIVGNKNLVDARVPALERAGVISHSNNDRLCPAWSLALDAEAVDDSDCVSLDAEVLIGISRKEFFFGAPTVLIQEFVTQTIFQLFPSNVCAIYEFETVGFIDCRCRFRDRMKPQSHSMVIISFKLSASIFAMLTPEDPKIWLNMC